MLSFHATKSFGTGEGGGVASTDVNIMSLVVQALNFGFYQPVILSRRVQTAR